MECLRENEIAILRTKKAMIRLKCGVKLIEKRISNELLNLLGLEETLDRLATVKEVQRYEHVLQRNNDDVLKRMLN